ncbi:hypothetical protein VTK73DRAFT_3065 [Phialemonium thermophilum]|uniref:Uncharacterized protein n=1 Tax=Phialemonium thermophilum TaxID=223376 RepID=A0ABR3VLJ4_9PEZI
MFVGSWDQVGRYSSSVGDSLERRARPCHHVTFFSMGPLFAAWNSVGQTCKRRREAVRPGFRPMGKLHTTLHTRTSVPREDAAVALSLGNKVTRYEVHVDRTPPTSLASAPTANRASLEPGTFVSARGSTGDLLSPCGQDHVFELENFIYAADL